MSRIDFSHLSAEERLELIDELWESLDGLQAPLTDEQRAELRRRRSTLEIDVANGRDFNEVMGDLRRRFG